jgi:hypothetical protein
VTTSRASGGRVDVGAAVWWIGLGALAGALAGFVWGAVGGRLVMLALRFTSPDHVVGVTTDDGFEIGQVTASGTTTLALQATLAGSFAGVVYVALRTGVPERLRAPLAALFGAAVGGATFVSPDGIDQRVLEPRWLTVGAFILLPAAATLTIALVVERVGRGGPRVLPPASPRLATAARTVVTLAGAALIVAGAIALADAVGQVT